MQAAGSGPGPSGRGRPSGSAASVPAAGPSGRGSSSGVPTPHTRGNVARGSIYLERREQPRVEVPQAAQWDPSQYELDTFMRDVVAKCAPEGPAFAPDAWGLCDYNGVAYTAASFRAAPPRFGCNLVLFARADGPAPWLAATNTSFSVMPRLTTLTSHLAADVDAYIAVCELLDNAIEAVWANAPGRRRVAVCYTGKCLIIADAGAGMDDVMGSKRHIANWATLGASERAPEEPAAERRTLFKFAEAESAYLCGRLGRYGVGAKIAAMKLSRSQKVCVSSKTDESRYHVISLTLDPQQTLTELWETPGERRVPNAREATLMQRCGVDSFTLVEIADVLPLYPRLTEAEAQVRFAHDLRATYYNYLEPSIAGERKITMSFYKSLRDLEVSACSQTDVGLDLSTLITDEESIARKLAVPESAGGTYTREFELTVKEAASGALRTGRVRLCVRYFAAQQAEETLAECFPREVREAVPGRFAEDNGERPTVVLMRWQGRLLPHSQLPDNLLPFLACPKERSRPASAPPLPPAKCFDRVRTTIELSGEFRPRSDKSQLRPDELNHQLRLLGSSNAADNPVGFLLSALDRPRASAMTAPKALREDYWRWLIKMNTDHDQDIKGDETVAVAVSGDGLRDLANALPSVTAAKFYTRVTIGEIDDDGKSTGKQRVLDATRNGLRVRLRVREAAAAAAGPSRGAGGRAANAHERSQLATIFFFMSYEDDSGAGGSTLRWVFFYRAHEAGHQASMLSPQIQTINHRPVYRNATGVFVNKSLQELYMARVLTEPEWAAAVAEEAGTAPGRLAFFGLESPPEFRRKHFIQNFPREVIAGDKPLPIYMSVALMSRASEGTTGHWMPCRHASVGATMLRMEIFACWPDAPDKPIHSRDQVKSTDADVAGVFFFRNVDFPLKQAGDYLVKWTLLPPPNAGSEVDVVKRIEPLTRELVVRAAKPETMATCWHSGACANGCSATLGCVSLGEPFKPLFLSMVDAFKNDCDIDAARLRFDIVLRRGDESELPIKPKTTFTVKQHSPKEAEFAKLIVRPAPLPPVGGAAAGAPARYVPDGEKVFLCIALADRATGRVEKTPKAAEISITLVAGRPRAARLAGSELLVPVDGGITKATAAAGPLPLGTPLRGLALSLYDEWHNACSTLGGRPRDRVRVEVGGRALVLGRASGTAEAAEVPCPTSQTIEADTEGVLDLDALQLSTGAEPGATGSVSFYRFVAPRAAITAPLSDSVPFFVLRVALDSRSLRLASPVPAADGWLSGIAGAEMTLVIEYVDGCGELLQAAEGDCVSASWDASIMHRMDHQKSPGRTEVRLPLPTKAGEHHFRVAHARHTAVALDIRVRVAPGQVAALMPKLPQPPAVAPVAARAARSGTPAAALAADADAAAAPVAVPARLPAHCGLPFKIAFRCVDLYGQPAALTAEQVAGIVLEAAAAPAGPSGGVGASPMAALKELWVAQEGGTVYENQLKLEGGCGPVDITLRRREGAPGWPPDAGLPVGPALLTWAMVLKAGSPSAVVITETALRDAGATITAWAPPDDGDGAADARAAMPAGLTPAFIANIADDAQVYLAGTVVDQNGNVCSVLSGKRISLHATCVGLVGASVPLKAGRFECGAPLSLRAAPVAPRGPDGEPARPQVHVMWATVEREPSIRPAAFGLAIRPGGHPASLELWDGDGLPLSAGRDAPLTLPVPSPLLFAARAVAADGGRCRGALSALSWDLKLQALDTPLRPVGQATARQVPPQAGTAEPEPEPGAEPEAGAPPYSAFKPATVPAPCDQRGMAAAGCYLLTVKIPSWGHHVLSASAVVRWAAGPPAGLVVLPPGLKGLIREGDALVEGGGRLTLALVDAHQNAVTAEGAAGAVVRVALQPSGIGEDGAEGRLPLALALPGAPVAPFAEVSVQADGRAVFPSGLALAPGVTGGGNYQLVCTAHLPEGAPLPLVGPALASVVADPAATAAEQARAERAAAARAARAAANAQLREQEALLGPARQAATRARDAARAADAEAARAAADGGSSALVERDRAALEAIPSSRYQIRDPIMLATVEGFTAMNGTRYWPRCTVPSSGSTSDECFGPLITDAKVDTEQIAEAIGRYLGVRLATFLTSTQAGVDRIEGRGRDEAGQPVPALEAALIRFWSLPAAERQDIKVPLRDPRDFRLPAMSAVTLLDAARPLAREALTYEVIGRQRLLKLRPPPTEEIGRNGNLGFAVNLLYLNEAQQNFRPSAWFWLLRRLMVFDTDANLSAALDRRQQARGEPWPAISLQGKIARGDGSQSIATAGAGAAAAGGSPSGFRLGVISYSERLEEATALHPGLRPWVERVVRAKAVAARQVEATAAAAARRAEAAEAEAVAAARKAACEALSLKVAQADAGLREIEGPEATAEAPRGPADGSNASGRRVRARTS